jgi:mono/diheme cytochrome c family protein
VHRCVVLAPLVIAAAVLPATAPAGVHVVAPFPPDRYADEGAVGLVVPGAGPTVTRRSALRTLLTGEVQSSLLGGAPPGRPRIRLGGGGGREVYVVLPPAGRTENDRRYPIAVVGDGFHGILASDSTRIPGLVSLADIANGRLRSVAADDPVATLATLARRIDRNDRLRLPLTLLVVAVAYAAAFFAPRLAPRVFLLAAALNLWLAGWWVAALVTAAALTLPLGLASGGVLLATLLALWLSPEAVALSPLGPSQAGRFYGVSNLLETVLLVPALVGAALLGRLGLAVAALAIVVVAGNRFGADGGGLLVLLVAYGVLWLRLRGVPLSAGRAATVAVAALAAGLVLLGLDALLGGSSHVTDAVADGPGAVLGDLADRLELSARRVLSGAGPSIAVALSVPVLLVVATRRRRSALADALLAGLLVSLVVNDTPSDVLGVGGAAVAALYLWDTSRHDDRPRLARLRAMRRAPVLIAILLATILLAAAGCGGGETGATPETVVGEVPTETTGGNGDLPALDLTGDAANGKSIFASAGCSACHTLSAAGSSGTVGPNLDDAKPSYELAVTRVTKGQGGMPSFADQLEPQEIADVAQFVADSTSG